MTDILAEFRHRMRPEKHPGELEESDLIPEQIEAEALDDEQALADDLEYPTGTIIPVEAVTPPEALRSAEAVEKYLRERQIAEMRKRWPKAQIRWDQEYAEVFSHSDEITHKYEQNGKKYDHRGMEIKE